MPTTEEIIPTALLCSLSIIKVWSDNSNHFHHHQINVVKLCKFHHDYQGKRKCDQYWPETGSQVYGLIDVLMLREEARLIIIIIIKISIYTYMSSSLTKSWSSSSSWSMPSCRQGWSLSPSSVIINYLILVWSSQYCHNHYYHHHQDQ